MTTGKGKEFNSAKLMFVTNWSFICYWVQSFPLTLLRLSSLLFLLCFAFINDFRRDLLIGNKFLVEV